RGFRPRARAAPDRIPDVGGHQQRALLIHRHSDGSAMRLVVATDESGEHVERLAGRTAVRSSPRPLRERDQRDVSSRAIAAERAFPAGGQVRLDGTASTVRSLNCGQTPGARAAPGLGPRFTQMSGRTLSTGLLARWLVRIGPVRGGLIGALVLLPAAAFGAEGSGAPSEALFLLQVTLLVFLGRLLGEAMQRLGQP